MISFLMFSNIFKQQLENFVLVMQFGGKFLGV